jgi:hypothetical protein
MYDLVGRGRSFDSATRDFSAAAHLAQLHDLLNAIGVDSKQASLCVIQSTICQIFVMKENLVLCFDCIGCASMIAGCSSASSHRSL